MTGTSLSPCPGRPLCPVVDGHLHDGDQVVLGDGWLVDLIAGRPAVEFIRATPRRTRRRKRRR